MATDECEMVMITDLRCRYAERTCTSIWLVLYGHFRWSLKPSRL